MKKQIVGQVVTFTFDEGVAQVSFDCGLLSRENKEYAVPFAMGHRLGDNAAIAKSKENNFRVTEAMRRAAIVELIEHYQTGSVDWSPKAGTRKAPQNATILAIAVKRGCSYEQAEAYIAEKMLAEMGA
jgi:hypothetical protein